MNKIHHEIGAITIEKINNDNFLVKQQLTLSVAKIITEVVKTIFFALCASLTLLHSRRCKDLCLQSWKLCRYQRYEAVVDKNFHLTNKIISGSLKSTDKVIAWMVEAHLEKQKVIKEVRENGHALCIMDDCFKKDADVALAAIENDPTTIKYVDKILLKDKDFALKVISSKVDCFRELDDSIFDDFDIMLAAVRVYGTSIIRIRDRLRNNKTLWMEATEIVWSNLYYLPDALKDDMELFQHMLSKGVEALQFASDKIKADRNFVLSSVKINGTGLEFVPNYHNDREVVEAAITNYGPAIRFADKELQKSLALLALENNPELTIQSICSTIKNDLDFCIKAIEKKPEIFPYLPEEIRNLIDVAKIAVSLRPDNYLYLNEISKQIKEIAFAAIKDNDCSANVFLKLDNPGFLTDPEFVSEYAQCYEFAVYKLKNNPLFDIDMAKKAIKKHPQAFRYLKDDWKNNPELILFALSLDGTVFDVLDPVCHGDKEMILMAIRHGGIKNIKLDDELKQDRQFVLQIARETNYAYVLALIPNYNQDREFMELAVSQDEFALKFAHPDLLADNSLIKLAISYYGQAALDHLDYQYRNSEIYQMVDSLSCNNENAELSALTLLPPKDVRKIISDYLFDNESKNDIPKVLKEKRPQFDYGVIEKLIKTQCWLLPDHLEHVNKKMTRLAKSTFSCECQEDFLHLKLEEDIEHIKKYDNEAQYRVKGLMKALNYKSLIKSREAHLYMLFLDQIQKYFVI